MLYDYNRPEYHRRWFFADVIFALLFLYLGPLILFIAFGILAVLNLLYMDWYSHPERYPEWLTEKTDWCVGVGMLVTVTVYAVALLIILV